MLLKCVCWSKKIEVAKASKGEEISVNLISSEYGKPLKYVCISHRDASTIFRHIPNISNGIEGSDIILCYSVQVLCQQTEQFTNEAVLIFS